MTPTPCRHRLAEAIKASGLSQAEVARRSGIRPATISEYLAGLRDIRTHTYDALLKAVSIPDAADADGLQPRPSEAARKPP